MPGGDAELQTNVPLLSTDGLRCRYCCRYEMEECGCRECEEAEQDQDVCLCIGRLHVPKVARKKLLYLGFQRNRRGLEALLEVKRIYTDLRLKPRKESDERTAGWLLIMT